jgi:hypothetical protein
MRKALLAVPQVNGDDPAGSTAARQAAIDAIAKKNGALATLLAIASEPVNAAHPNTPPERQLAAQIASDKFPSEAVRPLIVQAIGGINLELGVPSDLFGIIYTAGDGPDGAVASALVDKTREVLGKGQSPDALLDPLVKIAKPETHLKDLFKLLLTPDKARAAEVLSQLCIKIVTFQRDREVAVRAIAPLIDASKLPPYDRLGPAIEVLGQSRTREGADPISRILDVLERADRLPPEQKAAHAACIRHAYAALVTMWCPESRDRLLRSLDEARTTERRTMILDGFGAVQPGTYPVVVDFAMGLVERMSDRQLSDDEVRAYAKALHVITNKNFGNDPAAWQAYLDTLPR